MGEIYKDKNLDQIKNDVRKEFKRIDSFWIRDDQEIYDSGMNIIRTYRDQVLKSDRLVKKERYIVGKDGKPVLLKYGNAYWNAANKYFTEAYNKIVYLHNNVKGWIKFTNDSEDEKLIADVAKKIDKAENEALQKIADFCNPMQEGDNASYHSSVAKDNKGNAKVSNGEIVRQKPLFTQSPDGTITFTDRVNPIKIHYALGDLFKNKSKIYRIDYSKCKNQKIKTKMQSLIGGPTCWIKYDNKTQTYVLTDKRGNLLSNRALVWEGVTLKQDTIIESQVRDNGGAGITDKERSTLDNLRSASESYVFNASDFKYYSDYAERTGKNICAAYAYGAVSDILAKKGYCFGAPELDAWQISSSSEIMSHFNINEIDNKNPQQQIINAPAGSILTVRYDGTSARASGVSHAMVSLGNGVYTDLFGTKIRKIDFKSEVKFSGRKFTYGGSSFTFSPDARLITPNYSSFQTGKEQNISGDNLTPEEFVDKVHEATGAGKNYIRSLIVRKYKNISFDNRTKYKNLSIDIILREITELELENGENSNDVARDFLQSIKDNKEVIMSRYPNLTNHEYDEIAKRAICILYQESNAGDSTKYGGVLGVGGKEGRAPLLGMLITAYKGVKGEERSRGYTQMKYNQVFGKDAKKFLYDKFGITGGHDFTNAEKCGVATMVALIDKYRDYIVPMKSDPFRRNGADLLKVTFNETKKGKHVIEYFAKDKKVPIDTNGDKKPDEYRVRTEDEFNAAIKKFADENGGELFREHVVRRGIKNDDDFFDYLYYARNQPGELTYGTASPNEDKSLAWRYNQHSGNYGENMTA